MQNQTKVIEQKKNRIRQKKMQVEEFDREKKNLAWKMTADKGLQDNDKISRVCVRLLDESSIYIFN